MLVMALLTVDVVLESQSTCVWVSGTGTGSGYVMSAHTFSHAALSSFALSLRA